MATKQTSARKCLRSGYKYEFTGKGTRRWRHTRDEMWDIIVSKAMCGKAVGRRRIDGAEVTVVKVRGKLYAAMSDTVRTAGR